MFSAGVSQQQAHHVDSVIVFFAVLTCSLVPYEQVSRSSCHNYFMNVTDFGYNLVVDLDTRTQSSQLFLLVKASPILRHSLEDEHNYASYYQFKKQGDHHGVVVTSEHLSPGRWYIGVCNYVQEVALFDDKRSVSHSSSPSPNDAAYTVVATLNSTKEWPQPPDCGADCQSKEKLSQSQLGMQKRGFVSVDLDAKDASCSATGSVCAAGNKKHHTHGDKTLVLASEKARHRSYPTKQQGGVGSKPKDTGQKRAEEDERRMMGDIGSGEVDQDRDGRAETLFWAVRAEALEKELEKVREEMEIVKDELTGVLSHTKPNPSANPPLPALLQPNEDDHDELSEEDQPAPYNTGHPISGRRRRSLSSLSGVCECVYMRVACFARLSHACFPLSGLCGLAMDSCGMSG